MSKLKASHRVTADSQGAITFKETSTGEEKFSTRHPEAIRKVPEGQTSLTKSSNL